jgi:hypothetical protein
MKYAKFGVISEGTLRPEDLISSFSAELDYLIKQQPRSVPRRKLRSLVREAEKVDPDSEEGTYLIDELIEALNEFAPAYGRFGAQDGDGACFGFFLTDMICFDGLRVDDLAKIPDDYSGEALVVNDHGNMTLYAVRRGKTTALWAVV